MAPMLKSGTLRVSWTLKGEVYADLSSNDDHLSATRDFSVDV